MEKVTCRSYGVKSLIPTRSIYKPSAPTELFLSSISAQTFQQTRRRRAS